MKLKIELLDYWHVGGGRSGGLVFDAVVHRDEHGLPLIPGKQLKGLLRDALLRAEHWGWSGYAGLGTVLFGNERDQDEHQGLLKISDAELPAELRQYLASTEGKGLQPYLFRPLYATAIDTQGVAVDHSLRGIEVTVPLVLEAELIALNELPAHWPERLAAVLPLVHAVGAYRSRGLGRAKLSLEAV